MIILDLQGKTIKIESSQTTYAILKFNDKFIRCNFIGKQEFRLHKYTNGIFQYYIDHPLLLNYNEPKYTTYINSKPEDWKKLSADIQEVIINVTEGWRNWTDYVTNKNINFTLENFHNNLMNGAGILLKAPQSITKAITKACKDQNILTNSFEEAIQISPCKLIMVESDFVIARDFKITE